MTWWIAFEDGRTPGDWRVEAIDQDEGDVYVAVFSGPGSRERAEEYAILKNAQSRAGCRRWVDDGSGGLTWAHQGPLTRCEERKK
jgi:hypothetical protein